MRSNKKRSFCFGIASCPSKGAARNIKYKITSASVPRTYSNGKWVNDE